MSQYGCHVKRPLSKWSLCDKKSKLPVERKTIECSPGVFIPPPGSTC
jgi:hypothetical protein